MNKVYANVDEAVADIPQGASVALGGFFTAGSPVWLIKALAKRRVGSLTLIVQSVGVGNVEVNQLIENLQVKKVIANYPFYRSATAGKQHVFELLVRAGAIELEIYPMGTFIEKLRAAGAGIPAFYVAAGVGTGLDENREKRFFNDKVYMLETALKPDFALIHAYKGDTHGNLLYRKTARNYNNVMAMAADVTIAEVEELVEAGKMDPNLVSTPGIYVERVVKVEKPRVALATI
ncbi:MAG: CoA transferase subunit A [Chloroflexota bacterium]